jgi:hypothetical protein
MRSQSASGEATRRRAEDRFKSGSKADAKNLPADHALRQAEAEKTARLRVLRLAKEATDKETASRATAEAAARKAEPRRRPARPGSQTQPSPDR